MKILKTTDELFQKVVQLGRRAKRIRISTFGLWAGIRANGYSVALKYNCITYEVLRELINKDMKFIVGRPALIECCPKCPYCKTKHEEQVGRIATTLNKFSIPYTIVEDYHSKYYLFDTGDVIIGGMNFTTSNWIDYMFHIRDRRLYKELWREFDKNF